MSTTETTVSLMTESLTHWDELAIEKHWGLDVYRDGETKPMGLMRALVFVHRLREGLGTADALKASQDMPMKAVTDYFAPEPEEIDPEDPDTPEGKGSGPDASGPVTSPPSAS